VRALVSAGRLPTTARGFRVGVRRSDALALADALAASAHEARGLVSAAGGARALHASVATFRRWAKLAGFPGRTFNVGRGQPRRRWTVDEIAAIKRLYGAPTFGERSR